MLQYAIDAVQREPSVKPVIVVGHGAAEIRSAFQNQVEFAIQPQQLGTAHAVQQAKSILKGESDLVLVTYGDMPLVTSETIDRIVAAQSRHSGPLTMMTMIGQIRAVLAGSSAMDEDLSSRLLKKHRLRRISLP